MDHKVRTVKPSDAEKVDRMALFIVKQGWASKAETKVFKSLCRSTGQPERIKAVFAVAVPNTTYEKHHGRPRPSHRERRMTFTTATAA